MVMVLLMQREDAEAGGACASFVVDSPGIEKGELPALNDADILNIRQLELQAIAFPWC